ncbi:arylamine N-acetyltransferase [Paenibacillus sp. ACRRY]|uniref:arylamine N-acetyltransferase family protein n=1 Tax=Paenibacillus sp. ACRRY TaxID=2918208 RepID=UPI001EF42D2C|nr:arylamine N-acetyltransferase [Paenibacillus sp. ACRRY]MCG7383729.1 arylamine N-acetyltransferase [Paenibacillus sp. ACRRY]
MNTLTDSELKSYLKRIHIDDIKPPTLEFLSELHRKRVQYLSWQTIDIFTGRPEAIDLAHSVRLVLQGRSGYCFHLNGAFSILLHSLGYKVQWHRAGVQPHGEQPRVNSFHLGLSVLLPEAGSGTERWIVDVGLGGMPFEPLPLRYEVYGEAPFTYNLTSSSVASGGWRLEYEPHGPSEGVDYAPEVLLTLDEFIPKHHFYSQSAESPWHNVFLLRQRDAVASNELRGCMLRTHTAEGIHKTEIQSYTDWRELLDGVFHEPLVRYSELERVEMWERIRVAHEEWKRTQQV